MKIMGNMYRHDDYIEFKNYLMKMDECAPNYETFANTACLMEVFSEMSMFDAASGIMTALKIVYDDDQCDFILGFLSSMYESGVAQKSNDAYIAGLQMGAYPDNDGIDRDTYNSDDDDECDEFGEWR